LLVSAAHDASDADHGWLIICACFAILALHGAWHVAAFGLLAGFMFGFWPGLFANFLRLRRER
jgi:hypothetical protein